MAENAVEKPAEKKKTNKITIKQRVILLVSCPLIIILLSSIAIVITVHNIESGEIVEDTGEAADIVREIPAEFTAAPGGFCEKLVNDAAAATDVKINKWTGLSIHDVGGEFSDDVFKVINNVLGQITDGAKAKYQGSSVSYGESCALLKEFAAVGAVSTEASGEGKNDNLSYTLTLPADAAGIAPFTAEDRAIYEACKEECAGYVTFTDDTFELDSATAYYNCSYEKGVITSCELVREYKVTANASFTGSLDVFGSGTLTFGCRVNTKYDITHAGIFVQEELRLTKNGFQTLSISANVADDALSAEDAASEGITDPDRIFTVEFISSDESVATVDKTGMVEAVSVSEDPVTVTVKLTYRGNVYEDECIVYVSEKE